MVTKFAVKLPTPPHLHSAYWRSETDCDFKRLNADAVWIHSILQKFYKLRFSNYRGYEVRNLTFGTTGQKLAYPAKYLTTY